jgi:hypothetical protein
MDVKFKSYDGSYPNLCSGSLVITVDGKDWVFPDYCMCSGGGVSFDDDWNEYISGGEWTISKWPDRYPEEARPQTEAEVNANVEHGCCGGCV